MMDPTEEGEGEVEACGRVTEGMSKDLKGRKPAPFALILAIAFCLLGLWTVTSHFLARYWVEQDAKKLNAIVAELANEDVAFKSLIVRMSSRPSAHISGQLDSQGELERVRKRVATDFGDAKADHIVAPVRIRDNTAASRPS